MEKIPLGIAIICILGVISIVIRIFTVTLISTNDINALISKLPVEAQSLFSSFVRFALVFSVIGIVLQSIIIIGLFRITKWGFISMMYSQGLSIVVIIFSNLYSYSLTRSVFGNLASLTVFPTIIKILINITLPAIILFYLFTKMSIAFGKKDKFVDISRPVNVRCQNCGKIAVREYNKYYCYNCGKYVEYVGPQTSEKVVEKTDNRWVFISLILCAIITIAYVSAAYLQIEITRKTMSYLLAATNSTLMP